MIDIFQKLMMARQIRFESDGKISIFDRPLLMFPAEFLANLQTNMEKNLGYEKTRKILVEGFSRGGKMFTDMYRRTRKVKNKRDIIDWSIKLMTMAGWGEYKLFNLDMEKHEFVFHLTNSPFAKLMNGSNKPVDHIISGLIKGVAQDILFERPMEVKETRCQAMGHPFCEIRGKPKP